MTKIGVIIGSTRKGRLAAVVAEWFKNKVAAHRTDADFVYLDLAEQNLPFIEDEVIPSAVRDFQYERETSRDWSAKIRPLDGFIIITPEYNRGPSAVLKNALDTLYSEWNRKPVGFIGYGGTGGVRAIEQLRSNTLNLGMVNINPHVALNIFDYFDNTGKLHIPKKYVSAANAVIDEVIALNGVLKTLRK